MLYKKNLQLTGACKVGIIETKNNTFYNISKTFIYTKQYALRIHYAAHLYITSPQISIQYIQYTECMYTKQYTLYSASVYHFSPNQHSVYTVYRMHVY